MLMEDNMEQITAISGTEVEKKALSTSSANETDVEIKTVFPLPICDTGVEKKAACLVPVEKTDVEKEIINTLKKNDVEKNAICLLPVNGTDVEKKVISTAKGNDVEMACLRTVDKTDVGKDAVSSLPVKETNLGHSTFSVARQIVADYSSSGSDSSADSESDSDLSESIASESDESEESDYEVDAITRPVEEIKITVDPEQCKEVGRIKYIVENQVVVEPNVGVAALDLDTVLFLDLGTKALGRIEDVFGPVQEPLYSVMFTSAESITQIGIAAGMAVFFAPTTNHTSYVFLPDLLKMKGSDASWKHNQEPPTELQEFSDDEEEAKARGEVRNHRDDQHRSGKKRPHISRGCPRSSPRSPRATQRRYPPVPCWMPPIRPPLHFPQYPPPSAAPFNPNVPPPSFNYGIGPPPPSPPPSSPFYGPAFCGVDMGMHPSGINFGNFSNGEPPSTMGISNSEPPGKRMDYSFQSNTPRVHNMRFPQRSFCRVPRPQPDVGMHPPGMSFSNFSNGGTPSNPGPSNHR